MLPPLLRWDPTHLVVDLDRVEAVLARRLERIEQVESVRLAAAGDAVAVFATVLWKGMRLRASAQIAEIRLRRRHLGFRLRRIRGLGVRLPRAAVVAILDALEDELLTVFRRAGIVVVDLGRWLPPEVDVTIATVQAFGRELHVWLGRGHVEQVPLPPGRALPPGEA